VRVGFVCRTPLLAFAPGRLWTADVDRRSIKRVLDVRCVKFLDHFDAGAAVLGNLVNVSAFHEAHADVGMTQTVGGAPVPVAVRLEFGPGENPVEQFDVIAGKNRIGWLR
jgi:hypothetical protein